MPPFAEEVRKEIFKRDNGECQNDNCVCNKIYGKNGAWRDGWSIQMAHYPEFHQPRIDYDPSHGRASCWSCHIVETIQTGNHKGVATMYEQFTNRNNGWIRDHGWRDEKAPLQWYYDYAKALDTNDDPAIDGLVQAYQENFARE